MCTSTHTYIQTYIRINMQKYIHTNYTHFFVDVIFYKINISTDNPLRIFRGFLGFFTNPWRISLSEISLILSSANINPGGNFVEIDIWCSFSFKLEIFISVASIAKNDGFYWLNFYNFGNLEVFSYFLANNMSEKSGKINTQLATAKIF